MLLAGLMNPGWLIKWPSSLRHTAVSITRPRWSSETPDRMRSRSGVSCSENRHVRRPPSAVSRMRLQVVQNAWLTEEMKPMPPGAPSANLKRVAGPGRGSATGCSGNRASICSWMPAGHHLLVGPDVVAVKRHELDEAALVAFIAGQAREVDDLVVVLVLHDHHVQLDRPKPGLARSADAV